MKTLIAILVALLCSPSLLEARGGGQDRITSYDYHDYINESIQSKTFIRYQDGIVYDLVWSYDRSIPGEVLRTEIATISGSDDIVRKVTSKFTLTAESFNLVQTQRFDPNVTPPALFDTTVINPPIVKLTDSMVPGIAWASAGEQSSTYYGASYFTDNSELVAVESVSVTAGSFNNCLKIYSLHQYGGGTLHSQMDWICPDVGVVKRTHNRIMLDLASVTYNE